MTLDGYPVGIMEKNSPSILENGTPKGDFPAPCLCLVNL